MLRMLLYAFLLLLPGRAVLAQRAERVWGFMADP